ncbi:MAG: hypothetical protein J6B75_09015 [Ruminococcus sp.]|nr:hypothetical protein [Ruminococcus sp.]
MNEIKRALAAADESFLVNMANKGIYKRACKDIEGMMPIFSESADSISVEISGETVTLAAPLENSKCSCVSRTVCRHIVGAILLVRSTLTDEEIAEVPKVVEEKERIETEKAPEVPENKRNEAATKTLTAGEIKKINECALDCLTLLGDILRNGIVRLPESVSDNAEVSVVRCHALKMAEGERAMRSIGSLLNDYNEGRAAFSMGNFMRCFCNCIRMMETLSEEDINAETLGTFRQEYTPVNEPLKLMAIGQRHTAGGDYEGEIYYFLNLEDAENPFMSLSDVTPLFYDTVKKRRRGTFPWGMTTPLSNMMKKMFVLVNAKVNGGKISSSQETKVAMTMNANLNCNEMRQLIYTDFRQAAVDLYEKKPRTELERMLLLQPKRCMPPSFDKASQTYSMILEDKNGFPAYVRIKYRRENREFVDQLERIGEKMAENPDKTYTLLAVGSIGNDKFELYPIEIYDFIDASYSDDHELAEEYSVSEEELSYSEVISELIEEVEEGLELVVQCGLQTGLSGSARLENISFNYGLKGLSRLCAEFSKLAEAYRHDTNADIKAVLHKLSEINDYVKAAKERLSIILTLNKEDNNNDLRR